ncbi:MAG: hypothetical protein ACOY82_20220 [Pseudomonadota bacterium]
MTRTLPVLALAAALAACSGPTADDAPQATPEPSTASETQAVPAAPAAEVVAPASVRTEVPAIETLLAPNDTLATAKARLGDANVREQELAGAEGETIAGWVLYPDDPTRTAEVFLDDANTHPALLRIGASESLWRRADGIRMGLTSVELQTMNGGPFAFYGFDWDYGGTITDFRGGRLDRKGALRGGLTLCPPQTAGEDYPSGEGTFSSDDPRMIAKPAVVCEFTVPIGD